MPSKSSSWRSGPAPARRAAWTGRATATASSAHDTPVDGHAGHLRGRRRRRRCRRRRPRAGGRRSAWPRSSTSFDATWMALPAVCSEREPIVPAPRGHAVGVGVDERDLVHRDAEHLAGEHGERGVVTLAVHAGAGEHAGRAVVVDLDGAELDVQPDRRGDLDVGRHADAELLGVAAARGARLLGAQLVVAGRRRARRRAPSRTRRSRSWRRSAW